LAPEEGERKLPKTKTKNEPKTCPPKVSGVMSQDQTRRNKEIQNNHFMYYKYELRNTYLSPRGKYEI
jgi:hypothetical protein